jgi:hypothetical protein
MTRLAGDGSSLSELLGTYMNVLEQFAPASYTLSSGTDAQAVGISRHPMNRLTHVYDSLDQMESGPGVGDHHLNASA